MVSAHRHVLVPAQTVEARIGRGYTAWAGLGPGIRHAVQAGPGAVGSRS